jgi:hypothetical protein
MNCALRFFNIACASFTLAAIQTPALAQGTGIRFSDVAGTWEGRSMVGQKDSVFVTWVLTATPDGKGWTLKRANRDPVPVRIIAIGGDSIVWESGPYPSMLRAGQMATTRTVGHFKGDNMTGTWAARYASGDVGRGRTDATRKK